MENTSANTKSLSDSILELTKNASSDISNAAVATTSAATSAATSVANSAESSSGFLGLSFFAWIIIILILAYSL